jgi:hypothetical protein
MNDFCWDGGEGKGLFMCHLPHMPHVDFYYDEKSISGFFSMNHGALSRRRLLDDATTSLGRYSFSLERGFPTLRQYQCVSSLLFICPGVLFLQRRLFPKAVAVALAMGCLFLPIISTQVYGAWNLWRASMPAGIRDVKVINTHRDGNKERRGEPHS